MSGIRSVEWTIDAPHDEEASGTGVIEIDNDGNVSGEEEDVALWSVDEDSKDRNLITNVSAVLPIDADSNDITLTLKLTDRAGHKTTVEKVFSVDRSAPVVEVTYDNDSYDEEFAYETEYYKADRTAAITIKDRNFDVNSAAVAITRDGREVRLDELEWEVRPDEEKPGMTCYTTQYLFDRDGDYTILVTAVDMVEHEAEPYGEKAFTIDKTQPMISIEYDNNDGNGGYFDRGRTAVITVREHNFTPDRFVLTAKAALAGAGFDFPEMSDWESDGDIHKTTIRFTREGDYEFKAECTDKAGNDCARPLEELFTIDMTAPELSISDIEPNSANAGSVRPGISWSDINLDGPAEIILTGSNQGETSLPGESSDEETSGTFRYDNFPREKEVDDVYTLTAIAADMAGNETEKSVSFSVNRFGSVYTFTPSLSDINGKFLDRERDIVIHEINVDTLDPDSIEIKIAKNGQNAEETEITRQVTSSNVRGSWHMYDYLLPAENFSEEGVYAVAVNSVDRAGNLNDSTEESKEAELRFGIDKSEPLITAINIERDTTYPEDSKKVDFAINDNLLLEDVGVTVNGREVEAKSDGDVYSFTMRGSDEPREITVTAMDGAGNTSELMIPDVYVTKNLFIRWYTNTPLMIVTVCVLGLAAAAAALLFIRKLKLHRHMMREEAAEAENRDV